MKWRRSGPGTPDCQRERSCHYRARTGGNVMIDRRDGILSVLVAALLMAGFALKGALITPPAPPAQSQPGEFDTSRAIARLQRILGNQRPHPVDSTADDEVRARLMAEL